MSRTILVRGDLAPRLLTGRGVTIWRQDFAKRQRLGIDFGSDVSNGVSCELGISVLRVLQEALTAGNVKEGQRIAYQIGSESN